MKLREWEVSRHLAALLGEEAQTFHGSGVRDLMLRMWTVRPGFAIYQFGDEISIAASGVIGRYFYPDLDKITRDSLNRADRMLSSSVCDDGFGDPYVVEKLFT